MLWPSVTRHICLMFKMRKKTVTAFNKKVWHQNRETLKKP